MDEVAAFHVLIIEDHPLVAEAAAHKVALSPRKASIVVKGTAPEALDVLRADPGKWNLILLDLDVPGATGLSLASEIQQMGLAARTCILTGAERPDFEVQIVSNGFQGYLRKGGVPVAVLEQDLMNIVDGQRVFRLSTSTPMAEAPRLTARQAECLARAATGHTTKEIARDLGLHPGTVERHINASMLAMDASTRAQAAARALELGLISTRKPG